jgi:hypothetical protein
MHPDPDGVVGRRRNGREVLRRQYARVVGAGRGLGRGSHFDCLAGALRSPVEQRRTLGQVEVDHRVVGRDLLTADEHLAFHLDEGHGSNHANRNAMGRLGLQATEARAG